MKKIRIFNYSEHFRYVCLLVDLKKRDADKIREIFQRGFDNCDLMQFKAEFSLPSKSRIMSFFDSTEKTLEKGNPNFMTQIEFNVFMIGLRLPLRGSRSI